MPRILFFLLLLLSPLCGDLSPSPTSKNQESLRQLELLVEKEDSGGSKFMDEMLNMFVVLGGIVAVMFAVSWVLKKLLKTKMQQMNQTSGIKILERRALNPKAHIYLLEIHGRGFIVGESPQGIYGIGEFALTPAEQEQHGIE
jgi:flagellar biogenesis protein FliO